MHLEYFWILSRKPYLNEDSILDLTDKLALNGIISSYAIKTDQSGCIWKCLFWLAKLKLFDIDSILF